jgi:TPR repeat protein
MSRSIAATVVGVALVGCANLATPSGSGLPPGRCANPNDPTTSEPCPTAVSSKAPTTKATPSCTNVRFDDLDACCKAGNADHCFAGAERLKRGTWINASDHARAAVARLDFMRLGCEQNHAQSCAGYGEQLLADQHRDQAIGPLQKGCERGSDEACRRLDSLGVTRSTDPAKAAASVKAECNGGKDSACLDYAALLERGSGISADPAGAFALRESTCVAKPAGRRQPLNPKVRSACLVMLARAYQSGTGVKEDLVAANSLFEVACDVGDAASCVETAKMCVGAMEARQIDGASCYEQPCKAGDVGSCVTFAEGMLRGNPPDETIEAAIEAMRLPCQQHDPKCRPVAEKGLRIKFERAQKSIASLFTTCEQHRARIEQLRVAGIEAAKRRDQTASQSAAEKLNELEPAWNANLDKLQRAIDITTTGDDAARNKYVMDVRRRCSCDFTPSGRCRR